MSVLIYMFGFKDMAEWDVLWVKFGASDEWLKLRSKPEYANTVSKVRKIFLTPLDYSQI